MNNIIKKDILNVLNKSLEALRKRDIKEIKELSNKVIHNASIFQDRYSISVAVLIYSISKIIERVKTKIEFNICCTKISEHLKKGIRFLLDDNFNGFDMELEHLNKELYSLDPKLKIHIREVFEKARINKASRLYEHGISIERTAKLLGISEWELMDYTGKTGISEKGVTKNIKERISYARSLFK